MTAFNENNLNDRDDNLRTQGNQSTNSANLTWSDPFKQEEDPQNANSERVETTNDTLGDEQYGENSGILDSETMNQFNITPGPDDDDDDDDLVDDDDIDLDDEEDDTLIPIEEDDDDSLITDDDDDDILPGTDMDNDDPIDDDDDDLDDDTSVNRSTTSDLGSNVSSRDHGRSTGRMIDHEPGTPGI